MFIDFILNKDMKLKRKPLKIQPSITDKLKRKKSKPKIQPTKIEETYPTDDNYKDNSLYEVNQYPTKGGETHPADDNYVIKLIDLERYKKDNGFYEVNLYPDREFNSEVHVLLYKEESWGNYQYFQYFKMMDEQNIKVIIYCIFTLFPLASIVGHEIRMHKVDGNNWFGGLTKYGFDRAKAWVVYDMSNSKNANWDISNMTKSGCSLRHLCSWEICGWLVEEVYKRPMYIDSNAYNIFLENEFPEKCIITQIKTRRYRNLISKIDGLNLNYVLGTDEQIQKKIIREWNGSDYFLTYQILMSILNQVEFFGIAGATSLFSSVPTINALFMSDHVFEENVDDNSILFKTLLNKRIFNKETIGFFHMKPGYNSYELSKSWMWNSLEYILSSWEPSEQKPLVKILS